MKRLSLFAFLGLVAGVVAGCPVWTDDDDDHDWVCDDEGRCCNLDSDDCDWNGDLSCTTSNQCGTNETCGEDSRCHIGDCTIWGCSNGYSCVIGDDAFASCKVGNGGSDGGGGSGGGGGTTAWCGNPSDCAAGQTCAPDGTCRDGDCNLNGCIFGYACDAVNGACAANDPAACFLDTDCSSIGQSHACVNGSCRAPEDQCFDQAQCRVGDKCAEGRCIRGCIDTNDCSEAYACDLEIDICSLPARACAITNDCGSASEVCVEGACVARAGADGSCQEGRVWVRNGCVPDQAPIVACEVDGQQDACTAGSVCLHHACYISCDTPNEAACGGLNPFNECKPFTTPSGAHQVCGSSQNLGGECDPNTDCSPGRKCIDGFCR
jgi:hypothetical protein